MMSVILESPVTPPQRRPLELGTVSVEPARRTTMPSFFCVVCLAALCAASFGIGYLLSVVFAKKGE